MGTQDRASEGLFPERLVEEAGRLGLALNQEHLARLVEYYRALREWNRRLNLTRIIAWEEVQVAHFLDSLTGVLVWPAGVPPEQVADVGSGAGFPGLPLKVYWPAARLVLVESVGKKAAFLREVAGRLGLEGVTVLAARAEKVGQDSGYRETCDLVVARAVAALPVLLEYALPLTRPGGVFVAYKGREVGEEVAAAVGAMEVLGGRLKEVRPLHLPGMEGPRHLVVVNKVAPSPARYPRRPGVPAKRPL